MSMLRNKTKIMAHTVFFQVMSPMWTKIPAIEYTENAPSMMEGILHVGTNDVSHQPASRVAQGIANLGTQIVQDSPATSTVISSILPRTDKPELSKKVIEANKLLKAFCHQNNWDFMNHTTTIDSSSLNMRGLHLNRKGTATIASNISNYIHNS